MKNRQLVLLWLFIVGVGISIFWGTLIVVDPLGIWHFPIIKGFNNYKVSQPAYLDFFKPYEYRMVKPDVVFLGSSRVYVGLCPDDYPDESVKVYNMGMSSLSIRDAYQYLKFMIRVHKPKKVYLGLDFFQFNKENFIRNRNGFSQQRLDKISGNWFSYMAYKLQETARLRGMVKDTFLNSQKEPNQVLFYKGWDIRRGKFLQSDHKIYERIMNDFLEKYQSFILHEESFSCLEKIIETTKSEGVELVVFFNPISSDLLSTIWISAQYDKFEAVKMRVAQFLDYCDFAFINDKTTNLNLFYDCSHYRAQLGSFIFYALNCPEQKSKNYTLEKLRYYLLSKNYGGQTLDKKTRVKDLKLFKNNFRRDAPLKTF
ncbi:MAG: hypothetical protein VB083_08495 [Aminobacterium sp.]|uniref:hypothetical protein n=1 Tax=Aminobacterium sp. TaxID=1872491 RepID=UPI002B1F65EA|nr:hypothetical protein [Aminobacterium sp.]MEA4877936.1 hypothetical protein [Aminobacterium sp.]